MAQAPEEPKPAVIVDQRPALHEAIPHWAKLLVLGFIAAFLLLVGMVKSCQTTPQPRVSQQKITPGDPRAAQTQIDDLARRLAMANPTEAPETQSNPAVRQNYQPSQSAGSAAQKTPEEMEEEQLAAMRRKRAYDSLFGSPITVRAKAPAAQTPTTETAYTPSMADSYREHASNDDTERPITHKEKQKVYDLNHSAGKLHRLTEGAFIPCALVNKLDGSFAGPVKLQVTQPVYAHNFGETLIPPGSVLLGEAKRVTDTNQERLAVAFHRLVMPDGYTVDLDQFPGLDQEGATALKDKVNHHYLQIFGGSIALGAIAGLAQIGNYGGFGYDPGVSMRNGFSRQMAMEGERIFEHYLNLMPTITIRPGRRVDVYLTNDLMLPEYQNHRMDADL